jgi:virginiamycin B lyase
VRRALLAAVAAALVLPASAGAATITEFVVPAGEGFPTAQPTFIQPGPGGALWFTDRGGATGSIGRITPAGTFLERILPPAGGGSPRDLVAAPDGTVYWTSDVGIARRTTDGTVAGFGVERSTTAIALRADGSLWWSDALSPCMAVDLDRFAPQCLFPDETLTGRIDDLTPGADGRLWATFSEAGRIRRLATDESDSPLELAVPGAGPARIALGPDGNMWATMFDAGAVDRITPAGERTRFPLLPGSRPVDIAAGPDGALWITDQEPNRILRLSTGGSVRPFPIPTPASRPVGITAGPDGALWFAEQDGGRIGRVVLDGTEGAQDVRGPSGGGPRGGSGGGGTGGGGRERVAPRFLRAAAFSPARFRAGTTSRLTFALSEAGRVRIAIERPLSGRRVDGRCVKPTRRNRSRSRCTRYSTVATLRRTGALGLNTITFNGRVGGRALPARRYRVSVTVTDAAGNTSAPSRTDLAIARR